jgi:protein-S-isoprenylcysteine O-methyltransferase Ste14
MNIMPEFIFSVTFILLWIIYILIRVPYDKQYKREFIVRKCNQKTETVLLVIMSTGMLLIPLLWICTPLFDNFPMHFPFWTRITGIGTAILSLVYFYRIHKELGANWSPTLEGRRGQVLIKTGVYKRVRHPMYTQILIWVIAQILIISNWVAGITGLISWLFLYFMRIPAEEKLMTEIFGSAYIDYMKETGRIFPRLNSSK